MPGDDVGYDEFSMLESYARYEGIPWEGQPEVVRRSFEVANGQRVSALVWGDAEPELVLLHGSGQNAHTWDSFAMAIGRPLIAIDLPGHGHSDWRDDHDYGPERNASAIAAVTSDAAPNARAIIGMSLGGLTTIHLANEAPHLVRQVVIVDITPGILGREGLSREQRGAVALLDGPATFDSFEAMLAATAASVPGRPIESLRTGVRHNSRQLDDGRWAWIYDKTPPQLSKPRRSPEALWEMFADIKVPIMVVRGGRSFHTTDEDEAEVHRRRPAARVVLVEGAGHSVQSDQPRRLASLVDDFLTSNQP